MEILTGRVVALRDGGLIVHVPYEDYGKACLRQFDCVQVGLPDGRTITPEQRRKAYALLNEIAEWNGSFPETVKRQLKMEFVITRMQALEKRLFSLADCDVTTAREFISYLIDFMVEWGVPSKTPLYEQCEDIARYVYACLMHKTCAVCGKTGADLHHYDQIGIGGDRTETPQLGMRVLPLCRLHHGQAHDLGKQWLEGMHLTALPLSREIAKVYGLTRKATREKKAAAGSRG